MHGWPEAAPFDVIAVTAGGPALSQPLKDQLTIGGRLVMPVGDTPGEQRLIKVTRRSKTRFEEDDLGDLAFGPLPAEPFRPARSGRPSSCGEAPRRPAEPNGFRASGAGPRRFPT